MCSAGRTCQRNLPADYASGTCQRNMAAGYASGTCQRNLVDLRVVVRRGRAERCRGDVEALAVEDSRADPITLTLGYARHRPPGSSAVKRPGAGSLPLLRER